MKEILSIDLPCNIFIPDEGVWGVFINELRLKKKFSYKTINVQHGHFGKFYIRKKNTNYRRYFLNLISRLITKYPAYGYGVGYGKFDVYCCYSIKEYDFLKFLGHNHIFVCPYTIKKDLILKYHGTVKKTHDHSVVIFLPTSIPGADFKELKIFLNLIHDLVSYLFQLKYKVFLRLHPGGDRDIDSTIIQNSSINKYVLIEEKCSNLQSFKNHKIIMSAFSTALLEASILEKISIIPIHNN